MPLSCLVAILGRHPRNRRSPQRLPRQGPVRIVPWQMCPSLVLKSRNMKCCLNQPEMLSLPNMTHESRLCLENSPEY